ncbi:universal stress protein [Fulvivirga sp. RKSG066]|uniref:universal stress protein n=1 Tax=Fulvivirga aurantia TaxID=2529383 RepID=UPI0012BCFE69|nr:universal stress protein [Fulvivirga aurantia]MTI20891.1 universal stress protein [Fulvivirga aurantia]
MKNIIVPVDFSKQSKYALELALQIADKNNSEIEVIHAVEFPVGGVIDPIGMAPPQGYDKEFLDLLKSKGEERMDAFLGGVDTEKLTVSVVIGNPYRTIVDKLLEEEHDLIIMGTKGASGLREFFIGSNTEKVVRRASCPVMTVRESINVNTIDHIAFATGGMEVSESLMNQLKQLQEFFNAKIHMVRINTPGNFEKDSVAYPALQKVADRYMLQNYTINVYNDMYEEEGIMAFAEKVNADMIAMGTHGRRGFAKLLMGSLTEDVVNHANKLMWTYHFD